MARLGYVGTVHEARKMAIVYKIWGGVRAINRRALLMRFVIQIAGTRA